MAGFTTYSTFVTNLGDVTVTGVTTVLDEPPLALNTADLPALWVEFPEGEEGPLTVLAGGAHGGWPTHRAALVVAIEPVGQSRQVENWSAALTMIDAVATALRGATTVVQGPLSWSASLTNVVVGDNSYWAIVTVCEGNG